MNQRDSVVVVNRTDLVVVKDSLSPQIAVAGGSGGGGGSPNSFTFTQGDVLLGRISGAGLGEEIPCTSFGRSFIAAASGAAAAALLSLGTMASQNANAVAITGGTISASSITNTSMTAGSVLFAGAGGVIAQGNTSFFWDSTNKALYAGQWTTLPSPVGALNVYNSNTGVRGATVHQANNGVHGALLNFRKDRAGASVASGDFLGVFFAQAFDGTSYVSSGGFGFVVNGAVSTGVVPTDLIFSTGSSHAASLQNEVMRIKGRVATPGAVLIGTTTDDGTNKLQVTGGLAVSGNVSGGTVTPSGMTLGSVYFAGAGGVMAQDNANFFWDDTNNRLGVGTAIPGYAVDVAGFVNVNTASGYKQGGTTILHHDSTLFNTSVGQLAGNIAAVTGNLNTALGYNALAVNTNGLENVAVGAHALAVNTTGANRNTAVGCNALKLNTTGINNVAIGSNAMPNNTSGLNNVAIGRTSLNANTTGNTNVAIGPSALRDNNGTGNFGLGNNALATNTTGNNNVAIGDSAMRFMTAATGGSGNTAIGSSALRDITTGSNNIALGSATLTATFAQVTTGSRNISIGNDVAVISPTASEQLVIGNLIYAVGMDGTGATASTGRILIGTRTDNTTHKLQVAGGDTTYGVSVTGQVTITTNRNNLAQLSIIDSGAGGHAWTVGTVTAAGCFDFRDLTASGAPVRMTLNASGQLLVGDTTGSLPQLSFGAASSSGFRRSGNNIIAQVGISNDFLFSDTGLTTRSDFAFKFSSSTDATATADVILLRDAAAGVLALRNSTNAQTFRVYNTYTDASNFERAEVQWSGNLFQVNTTAAGSGTARDIYIHSGGNLFTGGLNGYWRFDTNSHFFPGSADNALDLGVVTTNRVRTAYIATSVVLQGPTGFVNGLTLSSAAASSHPSIAAAGADTDINIIFTPKGAGVVQYGTHSAIAAETVTGYITMKDSGGTTRKLAVIS